MIRSIIAAVAMAARLIPASGRTRLVVITVLTPVPLAVLATALDPGTVDLGLYALGWLVPTLLGDAWRSVRAS